MHLAANQVYTLHRLPCCTATIVSVDAPMELLTYTRQCTDGLIVSPTIHTISTQQFARMYRDVPTTDEPDW